MREFLQQRPLWWKSFVILTYTQTPSKCRTPSLYTMTPTYIPRASDVIVFRYTHVAIACVSPMLPLRGRTTQTQLTGLVMGCPYLN